MCTGQQLFPRQSTTDRLTFESLKIAMELGSAELIEELVEVEDAEVVVVVGGGGGVLEVVGGGAADVNSHGAVYVPVARISSGQLGSPGVATGSAPSVHHEVNGGIAGQPLVVSIVVVEAVTSHPIDG